MTTKTMPVSKADGGGPRATPPRRGGTEAAGLGGVAANGTAGRLVPAAAVPDAEVAAKAARRRFPAAYKLRILQEADACTTPGAIGALLRREGLYSSHLTTWRQQREQGALAALAAKPRGRTAAVPAPWARRLADLEQENVRLARRLQQAEAILAAQKKLSEILTAPLAASGADA